MKRTAPAFIVLVLFISLAIAGYRNTRLHAGSMMNRPAITAPAASGNDEASVQPQPKHTFLFSLFKFVWSFIPLKSPGHLQGTASNISESLLNAIRS
jgi:hypothetical protein